MSIRFFGLGSKKSGVWAFIGFYAFSTLPAKRWGASWALSVCLFERLPTITFNARTGTEGMA